MAEERILVLQANTTDFIYKHFNGNFFIPRQEAIERMAMAMFEWQRPGSGGDVPIEDVWQNEKCGFENLAEAALNALLEAQNER